MYACSECGKSVAVKHGQLIRTCKHDAPVTASIAATAKGSGGLS